MILTPPLKQTSVGTPRSLASLFSMLTQRFGERPEYYGPGGHNGVDWPCAEGTEVLASHDGEAAYYEEKNPQGEFIGYGKYVTIRDRNNGFKTEYCHLSRVVKTGQVKAGEVIGLSGNTGNSTGPHLHFTLKNPTAIDPLPFFVWFGVMNETLVKARQVCEGYLDPEGQTYWADKDEKSYWIARIQDKIKQLQEVLSELQK